jgi:DNA-binding CsgD family transcriptional regulator
MPGLFPNPLYLTKTERSELEELVKNHRQIARELKISRDTARHWRRRWLDMAGDEK